MSFGVVHESVSLGLWQEQTGSVAHQWRALMLVSRNRTPGTALTLHFCDEDFAGRRAQKVSRRSRERPGVDVRTPHVVALFSKAPASPSPSPVVPDWFCPARFEARE
jgi:hypothetical protein